MNISEYQTFARNDKHRNPEQASRDSHALIVGGSMAGLLAARVLSEYFGKVTVIERDALPVDSSIRKGVPQARHVHALLYKGQCILEQLFPGLFDEMKSSKPAPLDLGLEVQWLNFGILSARDRSGLMSHFQSRALLECHVRARLKILSNVDFIEQASVRGLVMDAQRQTVTGVEITDHAGTQQSVVIAADLVIDATGRGSQTPRWLEALGFPAPPEAALKIDFAYASQVLRRPPGFERDWKVLMFFPDPPLGKRGGYLFPIEDDCWLVTLNSRLGDRPPSDEAGFLEFARSLPLPDLYEAVRAATPVSAITTYGVPSNLRRYYERLQKFPNRLVILGDAVCSFNPVYGQGMTVCALEALALSKRLRKYGTARLDTVCVKVRRDVARIVDIPWMVVTTEDFRHPQTPGRRSMLHHFSNWYSRRVYELTARDTRVGHTFLEVMQMERHPAALYRAEILLKVVGSLFRRRPMRLAAV